MPLQTNGAEIRRRRELAGFTISALAERIEYQPNYVSQVELGNANGGPRFQRLVADALGCAVADITNGRIPYGEVGQALENAG